MTDNQENRAVRFNKVEKRLESQIMASFEGISRTAQEMVDEIYPEVTRSIKIYLERRVEKKAREISRDKELYENDGEVRSDLKNSVSKVGVEQEEMESDGGRQDQDQEGVESDEGSQDQDQEGVVFDTDSQDQDQEGVEYDTDSQDQDQEGVESDTDSQDQEREKMQCDSNSQEKEEEGMHCKANVEGDASLQVDIITPFLSPVEGVRRTLVRMNSGNDILEAETSGKNITHSMPKASTSFTTKRHKGDSATTTFEGFQIRSDLVLTLQKIWLKHGNIVKDSIVHNGDIIAKALESLATMAQILEDKPAQSWSDSATTAFEGFDIRSDLVPTLQKIWLKHGNIIKDSIVHNGDIIAKALESLATMAQILEDKPAQSLSDSEADYLRTTLSDLKCIHFNVYWLVSYVEEALKIHESKDLLESLNNLAKVSSQVKARREILLNEVAKLHEEENRLNEEMVKVSKMIPCSGKVKFDEPIGIGLT